MATAGAPHALYRFFSADDELLYVGITNNPARRFTQHGVSREWWAEVATIRMERHPDREAVLAAEKAAIQSEAPRYNVIHSGGPVSTEMPVRPGTAGGHPVAVGDCVGLGLTPTPVGDQSCPVGLVIEVDAFGPRLALFRWFPGTFDGDEIRVPWHRIMEIRWARLMAPEEARQHGYHLAEDDPGVFDCEGLGTFQTSWTHGKAEAKRQAIEAAEAARRRP